VEGLKAADPRHRSLNPEMFALDPLLQVLGDIVERVLWQEPVFPGGRDGGRIGTGPVCTDPVGREQGLVLQHLAEEALGRLQVALRRQVKAPERKSLTEAAGQSGCAGVKLRQQMAFVGKRQGPGDEERGALCSGSLCGSD
jgi:hypothetical protein